MSDDLERGIMVFRMRSDKEAIRTMAFQVAMLTTQCTKDNIKIIDCLVSFGGTKSVISEIGRLKDRKEFDYVLLYSPKNVCSTPMEYRGFVSEIKKRGLGLKVLKLDME